MEPIDGVKTPPASLYSSPISFRPEGGDILNATTILLGSTTTTGAPSAKAALPIAATDGAVSTVFGGSLVRALFDGKLRSAPATMSPGGSVLTLDGALVQHIREQLDRGVSLQAIVDRLASTLATSIANVLGIPVDVAQRRLTKTFTEALTTSAGAGPPPTNLERASSLVARFRQIAELATRVTNGEPGQPIRTIAGTSLDADSAKANPAPQPDLILGDAVDALTAASSLGSAQASLNAVAHPAPAASDGRTVSIASWEATASGGDTPLGRILARATLAGSSRAASGGPSPAGEASARSTGTPAAGGTSVAADGTMALDAFVHAFASALSRNDGAAPRGRSEATAAIGVESSRLVSSPVSAAGTTTAMPFGMSFAHDAAAIVPVPAAPPHPAQPAVDPQAVVDQLLRGVSIRTSDGSSTVRLRLVPENLGDVSVTLVVKGGSVDASITAHTVDAQNALAGGQAQLARTLSDAGLKLAGFSVAFAGGGFGDTRDQARPPSPARSNARRVLGIDAVDAEPYDGESSLLAVPTFGPPIYAASPNPWGYDYLV